MASTPLCAFFPNFTSNFLIWTLTKVKVKPYSLDLLMHNKALWTICSSRLHQHAHLFGRPFAYLNPLLIEPNSWKVFNLEASLATLNSSMIRLIMNPWLICLTLDCSSSSILSSWSSCHQHVWMSLFFMHCGLALTLDPPNNMLATHPKLSSTFFFINAWGHFFTFETDITSTYFSKTHTLVTKSNIDINHRNYLLEGPRSSKLALGSRE